jgi:hypothetical protein
MDEEVMLTTNQSIEKHIAEQLNAVIVSDMLFNGRELPEAILPINLFAHLILMTIITILLTQ